MDRNNSPSNKNKGKAIVQKDKKEMTYKAGSVIFENWIDEEIRKHPTRPLILGLLADSHETVESSASEQVSKIIKIEFDDLNSEVARGESNPPTLSSLYDELHDPSYMRVYDPRYERMGLPSDPYLRALQSIEKKEKELKTQLGAQGSNLG